MVAMPLLLALLLLCSLSSYALGAPIHLYVMLTELTQC
jgi:hypothetical protein